MTKPDFEEIILLARRAGEEIMKFYSEGFAIEQKKDDSPVTEADLAADKIIVDFLKEKYPDYGLLTEESEDSEGRLEKEFVWIVDPLDGTKEFINKNGEFTVNIGLAKKGVPVFGVVYAPAVDELYYGIEGEGAWCIEKGEKRRIGPSQNQENIRLAVSRMHLSQDELDFIERNNIKNTVKKGSSLKGCWVACGKVEAHVRYSDICEWDVCAMDAIIRASGSMITKISGGVPIYNKPNIKIGSGFLMSNKEVHERLIL